MELNIYNRAGELKETVSPSSSSQWVREIGAEYVVSLSFKTWDFFMLDVNDYIEMGGCKFKIKKEYRPKQISTQEYSYQVHFYGREHDAEDIKLCRLTQGEDDLEVTFAYEATPLEMLTKVVQNLNRNTDNVIPQCLSVSGTESNCPTSCLLLALRRLTALCNLSLRPIRTLYGIPDMQL